MVIYSKPSYSGAIRKSKKSILPMPSQSFEGKARSKEEKEYHLLCEFVDDEEGNWMFDPLISPDNEKEP
jgi:hypothetical protein